MYPQLSFLLLVFFVWQYIDSQQPKSLPILDDSRSSDRSTIKSPFASASKPKPSRTGTSSTTGNMAAESKHKVVEESSKGIFRSSESQKGPENETGAEEKKLADLESLIKKLKSEKDLTPGLKDQLKKAFQAREELVARLQRKSNGRAEPPNNDANHTAPGEEIKKPTNKEAEDDRTTKKRLMRNLAEVESYLKKHHAQDKVSNGSEEKLSKVKAQREVLKTEIANLQRRNVLVEKGQEPGVTISASKDIDHRNESSSLPKQQEGKPQRDERASKKEYCQSRQKH